MHQTELVDNSAPTPISFKAVTGKMTKAEQTSNNFLQDLGVFAYVHNTSDLYFDNTKFTKKSETVTNEGVSSTVTYWDGGKYWPFESSLNFVVYSPYNAATTYNYANSTLSVSNVNITPDLGDDQLLDMDEQIDYLCGSEYFKGTDGNDADQLPDGYNKNSGNVATTLKHASAKLTLSFKGENVTINSVSILGAAFEGSYKVTYTTGKIEWDDDDIVTVDETDLNWRSAQLTDNSTQYPISVMVVPTVAPNVKISYRITGTQRDLDANITLSDQLVAGCEHTYVITVTPRAIQFGNPSINGWDTGTATDPLPIN